MDTRERHLAENANEKDRELREARDSETNKGLLAEGKELKRRNRNRTNNLWLWLAVLILVFILIWWLATIGIFGDLTNAFNG